MAEGSSGRLKLNRKSESLLGGPETSMASFNSRVKVTVINGRTVAIREVHYNTSGSKIKHQFLKECQLLLTLRHENIIRCLEYRISQENPTVEGSITMELCQGTLQDYLSGQVPETDLKPSDIMWQVSFGLDYLHQNSIVHGDLKAKKILLLKREGMEVMLKITGFGILGSHGKKKCLILKQTDDILALGEIGQSVLDQRTTMFSNQPSTSLLTNLIELLKNPQACERPESSLVICHPFFILLNEEARHHLMELMMFDKDILVIFGIKELEKWYRSIDENTKNEVKGEQYGILENLIEKFSVDLKFMWLMTKGCKVVPRLLSHFIWHSMVSLSQKPRITVGDLLGKGSYGLVYRGVWKDKKRNIQVAFKRLNPYGGLVDESGLEHEMDVLRLMDSAFVVKLFGIVKKNGVHFMAMEMCQGNLHQYIDGMLLNVPAIDDKVIIGQIVMGLGHIHGRGIVHRDLCPQNILIWRNSSSSMTLIKVAGFMCSQSLVSGTPTAADLYPGTSGWVAPEVVSQGCNAYQSDVWSLGIIAYFVMTKGRHPYEVRGFDKKIREVFIKTLRTIPHMAVLGDRWDAIDLILHLTDYRPKHRPNIWLVLCHPYFTLSNDATIRFLASKVNNFRRFSSVGQRLDEYFDRTRAEDWYQKLKSSDEFEDRVKYHKIISMWRGESGSPTVNASDVDSMLKVRQVVSKELDVIEKIHEIQYPSYRKLMELLKTGPRFFATYVWNALDELRLKEDDYQKYFQLTQMEYAMVYGSYEFFSNLWKMRMSGDRDVEKMTRLLHMASVVSLPTIVTFLLSKGADVTAVDEDGRTALHLSVRNCENPDIAGLLLKSGADINSINHNNGSTPLHVAAWNNPNPNVIQYLLHNGANIKAVNNFGSTPLHLAAWNNQNTEVIKCLLSNGSSLRVTNKHGSTPLHLAAWSNPNLNVVLLLLEHGANYRAMNKYSSTPLHVAALNNRNPQIVEALLEKASDLLQMGNKYGSTPLHLAALNNGNPSVLRLLVDRGAELNIINKYRRTPLHLAARHNANPEILRFLLDNGADSNSVDQDGKKPVDHAGLNGNNPKVVRLLLNPDAESDMEQSMSRSTLKFKPDFSSHKCFSTNYMVKTPSVKRNRHSTPR